MFLIIIIICIVFLATRKRLTLASTAKYSAWVCYGLMFLDSYVDANLSLSIRTSTIDLLGYAAIHALPWGTFYLLITVGLARFLFAKKFAPIEIPEPIPEPQSESAPDKQGP